MLMGPETTTKQRSTQTAALNGLHDNMSVEVCREGWGLVLITFVASSLVR